MMSPLINNNQFSR